MINQRAKGWDYFQTRHIKHTTTLSPLRMDYFFIPMVLMNSKIRGERSSPLKVSKRSSRNKSLNQHLSLLKLFSIQRTGLAMANRKTTILQLLLLMGVSRCDRTPKMDLGYSSLNQLTDSSLTYLERGKGTIF